jgi:hypothetical protein
MIYTLFFMAILFGKLSIAEPLPIASSVHSVCDIVEHRQKYEGKEVTVESVLVASRHGAVLAGKPCGEGIYISHEAGRMDGKWPAFDNALVKVASGLETAPLRVRVKGVYRSRVPDGKRTIRQIELNEIMEVEFLPKP